MATATAVMAQAVAAMNSVTTDEPEEDKDPTFVTILFGDNQQAIFNPRCKVDIFMEHIRKKCCLREKSGTIDLVDLEGEVKNLSTKNKENRYATEHINSRGCYILVKVEKPSDREPVKYVPLLKNLGEINPELYEKLNNLQVKPQGPSTPRLTKKDLKPNSTKRQNSLKSGSRAGLEARRNSTRK